MKNVFVVGTAEMETPNYKYDKVKILIFCTGSVYVSYTRIDVSAKGFEQACHQIVTMFFIFSSCYKVVNENVFKSCSDLPVVDMLLEQLVTILLKSSSLYIRIHYLSNTL